MNGGKNPFDNVVKKTESFLGEIKKFEDDFQEAQKKNASLSRREKVLQKERDEIVAQENKMGGELLSFVKSLHTFLQETTSYSNKLYQKFQAEINYRAQAEAAQRALAEAAQSVLDEAAGRAKAEADYRKQAHEAQKALIEKAQKAQAEAAKRIQAELSKSEPHKSEEREQTSTEPQSADKASTVKEQDDKAQKEKADAPEKGQNGDDRKKKFSLLGKKS